jgi:hypothetical protein
VTEMFSEDQSFGGASPDRFRPMYAWARGTRPEATDVSLKDVSTVDLCNVEESP